MSGESRDTRVGPEIGRSLEEARKSKGLTLQQVEQETRIRSRYLRDLEQENFDVLPAVYVLGSLKTYADFLGLDGAVLARQLKASLLEPAEPGVPEQLAALGETRDEDDQYEAAPVPAVGFDQLFLGMGVILISILAVMTIVAAVAQGNESPVSQINQPSTPDASSEIALAGNVQDGNGVKWAGDEDTAEDENKEEKPEAPKDDGDESKDEGEGDDQEASQSASLFGDADFVPVPPSSPSTTSASASASPSPASSNAASPEPMSAEPDDSQASTAPAATAPASTGASPEPAAEAPGAASPAPAPAGGGGSPQAGGGGGGQSAPAGEADSDLISAETDRKVDAALDEAGIAR